jgi:hypothetical protein
MKSIGFISIIVSIIILYWFTSVAYNRVIKVEKVEFIPILQLRKCVITHIDFNGDNVVADDLNIYYSGTDKTNELPKKPTVNNEEKIQEEILKVVKDKQIKIEAKTDAADIEKIPVVKKEKKEVKTSEKKPANEKKIKETSDDTFSLKKKNTSKGNQTKKNVFDVIE